MSKITQRQWIETQLRTNGCITRNECLRVYISRLAAVINDLENDGWKFNKGFIEVTTPFGTGKDYKYNLVLEGN